MLTIEELMILRQAIEKYAKGELNREFAAKLQSIERKLELMIEQQAFG